MGAIVNLRTHSLTWTFMAFDPNDRTHDFVPDDLFADGVNLSLGATHTGKIGGRTTISKLSGIYTNRDGANLGELLVPPDLKTGPIRGSYNVSFQFSHFLVEHSPKPGDGRGLFFRGTIADGNPNPVRGSLAGGIGGKGLFPGRIDDSFGAGA